MENRNTKDENIGGSGNDAKLPVKRSGGTFAIAWGRNGGFGWHNGYTKRLCLWRVAIYFFPEEIEDILGRLIKEADDAAAISS